MQTGLNWLSAGKQFKGGGGGGGGGGDNRILILNSKLLFPLLFFFENLRGQNWFRGGTSLQQKASLR